MKQLKYKIKCSFCAAISKDHMWCTVNIGNDYYECKYMVDEGVVVMGSMPVVEFDEDEDHVYDIPEWEKPDYYKNYTDPIKKEINKLLGSVKEFEPIDILYNFDLGVGTKYEDYPTLCFDTLYTFLVKATDNYHNIDVNKLIKEKLKVKRIVCSVKRNKRSVFYDRTYIDL